MRTRLLLGLFVLSLVGAVASVSGTASRGRSPQSSEAAEIRAIEELHRRDVAATKAFDVETLASLWTDDIVALAPGQPPLVGKQVGRAMLEAGREQSRNIEVLEYDQSWAEIQVVGEYAFEWGTFQSVFRPKGGQIVRQNHKVLRILRRQADGSWKVHRTIWNDAPTDAEKRP